jgi:hypothetical protein
MTTLQLQFLMLMLAGWVNRSQQDVIEYLQEENQVVGSHYRYVAILLSFFPSVS